MRAILGAALAALALAPGAARAQTLTAIHRSTVAIGSAAVDQHGTPFAVTGLSGLTHLGGRDFAAVMDNSDKIVLLEIILGPGGAIDAASIAAGLSLEHSRDWEGIACTDAVRHSAYLSEEGTPGVREYDLADGSWLATLATPSVFSSSLPGRGFESLTRWCNGAQLWTANEEALTVDGLPATPGAGTTVRLLRYDASGPLPFPASQYAYEVDPMHGPYFPGGDGQSGLVELVQLPGGALLALERSLALALPFFESRLVEIDLAGATDVSGLAGLTGASYAPVGRHLLWSGGLSNLEGLCAGPSLAGGGLALIGVVDDGDPLSQNALVSFELLGPGLAVCACSPPVTYCAAKPSSLGCLPEVVFTGSPSASDPSPFEIRAVNVLSGKSGVVFYGLAGRAGLPFQGGLLCAAPPLRRTGVQSSGGNPPPTDCSGALGIDFNAWLQGGSDPALAAGVLVDGQFWFRDPLDPAGFGTGLSDAIVFEVCP